MDNLWQDYLFVTREMSKSLIREDFDLFLELLQQRQGLQEMIDSRGEEKDLARSCTQQELLIQIRQEDQEVEKQLLQYRHRWQSRRNGAKAYDQPGWGGGGRYMDRQA